MSCASAAPASWPRLLRKVQQRAQAPGRPRRRCRRRGRRRARRRATTCTFCAAVGEGVDRRVVGADGPAESSAAAARPSPQCGEASSREIRAARPRRALRRGSSRAAARAAPQLWDSSKSALPRGAVVPSAPTGPLLDRRPLRPAEAEQNGVVGTLLGTVGADGVVGELVLPRTAHGDGGAGGGEHRLPRRCCGCTSGVHRSRRSSAGTRRARR